MPLKESQTDIDMTTKSDQAPDKIHKGLLGRVSDVTKTILNAGRVHRSGQLSRSIDNYRGSRRKALSISDPEPRYNSVIMDTSNLKSPDSSIPPRTLPESHLPPIVSPKTPDFVIPEIKSPGIQSLMMENAMDKLLKDDEINSDHTQTDDESTVTENAPSKPKTDDDSTVRVNTPRKSTTDDDQTVAEKTSTKLSINESQPIVLELPKIEPMQEGPLTLADSLEHAFRAISISFDSPPNAGNSFEDVSGQANRVPSSVYESSSLNTNAQKFASHDSVTSAGYTDSDKVVADESSMSSNDAQDWPSHHQTRSEEFVFEDYHPAKRTANFYQQHTEAIMRDMELQRRVRDSFNRKREGLKANHDRCSMSSQTSGAYTTDTAQESKAASANIIREIHDVHENAVSRHTESRQRSNLASEIRGLPRFISVHAETVTKI